MRRERWQRGGWNRSGFKDAGEGGTGGGNRKTSALWARSRYETKQGRKRLKDADAVADAGENGEEKGGRWWLTRSGLGVYTRSCRCVTKQADPVSLRVEMSQVCRFWKRAKV